MINRPAIVINDKICINELENLYKFEEKMCINKESMKKPIPHFREKFVVCQIYTGKTTVFAKF